MSGERVLVVDDSKYMISFLGEKVLPTLGYKPLVASSGQRALELVAQEEPDLILLDFNLPDMTGMDVLHHLAGAGNRTPVILMTAYGSEQVAVEAFRLGVRDYLAKPIELDDVARAIERALVEPRLQRDRRQLAEELHRANVELRRQAEHVNALTRIGRAITASLQLDQILTMVSDAAIQLCMAEEASIWLLEDGRGDLILVAEKGVDQTAIRYPRMRVDDRLAGETVRTRRSIHRVADRDAGIEIKTGYLVRAVMYVPIIIQERCLGVVSVANRVATRVFEPSQQKNLQALTDYAAIAIENAKRYQSTDESLQRRLDELAAINDISEAVATLDLKLLFRRAINRIHQTFDVESAVLFLADEGDTALRFTLASNLQSDVSPGLLVPSGKGIVGSSVFQGVSLLTNDPHEHPLFAAEYDEITGFKSRSLLAVPLVIKDRLIGAIELVNKRSGPFDDQDARLLRALAISIGVAVDNASLFEQVARERATLHAVLDGNANPVAIMDLSGRIVLSNPAFQDLFGLSSDTAVGEHIAAVKLPRLVELVTHGQSVTEEIPFRDHIFLTNVATVAGVASIIVMQDITYLKDLDRAKSEFVAAVSHDLRAPLAALTGFVELLPEVGALSGKQEEYVGKALRSADRMKSLINDLLDLAKVEARIGTVDEPCDLHALAEQVVDQAREIGSRGLQLSLHKRGVIPTVRGNPDQLQRALANLVDNAMKYTPAGGQIRVGLQATVHSVQVAVLDTGCGIGLEDLPHVFEPFYRGEQSGDEIEGSGLGLTMVKSIVEAHKGTITVRSQPGRGSIFTITLPVS